MRKIITICSIISVLAFIAFAPATIHAEELSIAQQSLNAIKDIASGISGFSVGWISLKAISWVLFVINYFIGLIGSTLFILSGGLVELGLKLNTTILDSSVVQLGWRIVRDFANLGFTIGIVIIAYATILGYESYGIKKTLRNLIVMAFLVNFSFSIAGFLIDGSNIVTHFFVTKATGGGMATEDSTVHALALNLAYAFSPQKLFDISDPRNDAMNVDVFTALTEAAGGALKLVITMFFITLFTLFASFGMLTAALTILSRYIWLSGLVIVMPGAILCYVFPHTKQYWNKWYEKFTCQLLYLPALTFSMYLMLMYVGARGVTTQTMQAGALLGGAASAGGAFNSMLDIMAKPFQTISDMIVMLAMLFFGIMASQKMSCAGGKIVIEGITSLKNWAIGTVKGAPGTGTRWALNRGPEPDKSMGNKIGNFMAKTPFLRGALPAFKGWLAGGKTNIDRYANEFNNQTKAQRLAQFRSTALALNPERMAGALTSMIKNKDFHETDPEKGLTMRELERFMPIAKRYGIKDILTVAPERYVDFGMDEKKLGGYMREKMSAPEAMDIVHQGAFKNEVVVVNLNNAHLKRLSEGHNEDKRNELLTTLRAMHINNSENLPLFIKNSLSKPKSLEDVHPDIIKENGVFMNLNETHAKWLGENGESDQKSAFFKKMHEIYTQTHLSPEQESKFDVIAGAMMDAKTGWAGFNEYEPKMYKEIKDKWQRHKGQQPPDDSNPTNGGDRGNSPTGGSGSQPPSPPPTPPAPPSPQQLDRLTRTIWDINAARQNNEQVITDKENQSVVNSAQEILKQAEKKYTKITGQQPPPGTITYPSGAIPPEPSIIPGKPNPLLSNTPPPPNPPIL